MTEPPYSYLPKVYDEVVDLTFYSDMIHYLQKVFDKFEIKGSHILDLACGTGKFALEFARKGYKVTAIDISPCALEVARDNAIEQKLEQNIEFINRSMLDLESRDRFDVVLCLYNSLNYIRDEKQLKKTFRNIWKALIWGGYLLFDINTITGLDYIVGKTSFCKAISSGFVIADGFWDEELKQADLEINFLVHQDDDLYRLVQEVHQEKGFYINRLKRILSTSKFQDIQDFECFTFNPAFKAPRAFFIARKPTPDQLPLKLV
ncbi:class I SAM-dependent methyltransferase [bacterium]|nr:class I SAM-dependent methyltransferase [bacterium]